MSIIDHSVQWAKGEIFEAGAFGLFGLTVLIISFVYWKFGHTPNARAVIIPLLVVGSFYAVMGVSGIVLNKQRIYQFQEMYGQDSAQFIVAEKSRVEGFDRIFNVSYPVGALCVVGGLVLFLFVGGPLTKGAGLGLLIFGGTMLTIDYFASERAGVYYQQILDALPKG